MTNEQKNQNNEPDLFNNDLFVKHPSQREIPGETPEPPNFQREPENKPEILEPVEITPPVEPEEEIPEPQVKPLSTETEKSELPQIHPAERTIENPVANKAEDKPVEEATQETKTPQDNQPAQKEKPEIPAQEFKSEDESVQSPPLEAEAKPEEKNKDNSESAEKSGGLKKLFRKKHEKIDDFAAFGILLRNAREVADISIDEVARKTRIKKSYIDALEQEDFSRLPSKVYIRAYIRTLGELYNMEAPTIDEINRTLKDSDHLHLGEEVYNTSLIYSSEEDEEELNLNKQNFPFKIIIVLIVLLLALIITTWFVYKAVHSAKTPDQPAQEAKFDASKLNEFEQDQLIKMSEMPVPE